MDSARAMTWLEKLEEQLNVDVDSMDPLVAQSLPFKGHNQTSNQLVVYEQMTAPENRDLFLQAVKEYKDQGWEAILNHISVLLCFKNIPNITGRVLLQTSAGNAYDTQKIVGQARFYADEFAKVGIEKHRFCIKIPCTGPALNAGRILTADGIRVLGTSLFSLPQAIAASQAGCLYVSPYFNELKAHFEPSFWPGSDDPATKHTMAPRLIQMHQTYTRLYQETGKEQPILMPASFVSPEEIMAVAEIGCFHATIGAGLLAQLSTLPYIPSEQPSKGQVPPKPVHPYRDRRPTPARLVDVGKTDPLAPEGWDGKLASTEVDYLNNGGEELSKAIEADTRTKERLGYCLEVFDVGERKSRAFIEEAMAQM